MKRTILLGLAAALCACSPRTIAVRQTGHILVQGAGALYDEPDPDFARDAMPAQLTTVEALLSNDPKNAELLTLASEGFGGYSFLFLDDSQPERAKGLYLRARDFGLRALAARSGVDLAQVDESSVPAALDRLTRADVPALFWSAFGWAGYINLSKDSPSALSELPRVVDMMKRVRALDPGYHFAGADVFLGVYYASRPAMLGGDPAKAKKHFEEARRLTGGKFLMTYVLEAQTLAVDTQDQELFKSLLTAVDQGAAGALPESRLTDEVAKRKAAALLEKINDLF